MSYYKLFDSFFCSPYVKKCIRVYPLKCVVAYPLSVGQMSSWAEKSVIWQVISCLINCRQIYKHMLIR